MDMPCGPFWNVQNHLSRGAEGLQWGTGAPCKFNSSRFTILYLLGIRYCILNINIHICEQFIYLYMTSCVQSYSLQEKKIKTKKKNNQRKLENTNQNITRPNLLLAQIALEIGGVPRASMASQTWARKGLWVKNK